MSQYIYQYINFIQDNWDDWFPLTEFAACNVANNSTGMFPFFVNTGYHPHMSFGPPCSMTAIMSNTLKEDNKEDTDFVSKIQEITDLLRMNMFSA
jgi:hypothetical protein